MNVLILLIVVGIGMVTLALLLFGWTLRARTFDHSDRLALLPLADDAPPRAGRAMRASAVAANDDDTAESAPQGAGTNLENDGAGTSAPAESHRN